MFKEITATFKITVKDWTTGELIPGDLTVEIRRRKSGAFEYGDRSSHDVLVNGNNYKSFDTRYDRIPTEKEKWLNEWKEWMKENWKINSIELIDYSEKSIRD